MKLYLHIQAFPFSEFVSSLRVIALKTPSVRSDFRGSPFIQLVLTITLSEMKSSNNFSYSHRPVGVSAQVHSGIYIFNRIYQHIASVVYLLKFYFGWLWFMWKADTDRTFKVLFKINWKMQKLIVSFHTSKRYLISNGGKLSFKITQNMRYVGRNLNKRYIGPIGGES